MTDDEKRELIAEAIAKSDDVNHEQLCGCRHWPDWCSTYDTQRPWSHDAEFVAGQALRLADALEGTLDESEWEYATTEWGYDRQPHGRLTRGEITPQQWFAELGDREGLELLRRRKVGEWEVVTDDRD